MENIFGNYKLMSSENLEAYALIICVQTASNKKRYIDKVRQRMYQRQVHCDDGTSWKKCCFCS